MDMEVPFLTIEYVYWASQPILRGRGEFTEEQEREFLLALRYTRLFREGWGTKAALTYIEARMIALGLKQVVERCLEEEKEYYEGRPKRWWL